LSCHRNAINLFGLVMPSDTVLFKGYGCVRKPSATLASA